MELREGARRHGDTFVAVGLAVLYTSELTSWEPAYLQVAIPCALIASLTLSLRRSLPLVSFVVVMAANYLVLLFAPGIEGHSIAFLAIALLALYSLGRYARGTEAWLAAVAVLATVVGFLVLDGVHGWRGVAFAAALIGTPWAAGLGSRVSREHEVEQGWARVARDLHDLATHAVSENVHQAQSGRRMLAHDDEAVRRSLDAIEQTGTQCLADIGRLLSPPVDTGSAKGAPRIPTQRQGSDLPATDPALGPQPSRTEPA